MCVWYIRVMIRSMICQSAKTDFGVASQKLTMTTTMTSNTSTKSTRNAHRIRRTQCCPGNAKRMRITQSSLHYNLNERTLVVCICVMCSMPMTIPYMRHASNERTSGFRRGDFRALLGFLCELCARNYGNYMLASEMRSHLVVAMGLMTMDLWLLERVARAGNAAETMAISSYACPPR